MIHCDIEVPQEKMLINFSIYIALYYKYYSNETAKHPSSNIFLGTAYFKVLYILIVTCMSFDNYMIHVVYSFIAYTKDAQKLVQTYRTKDRYEKSVNTAAIVNAKYQLVAVKCRFKYDRYYSAYLSFKLIIITGF